MINFLPVYLASFEKDEEVFIDTTEELDPDDDDSLDQFKVGDRCFFRRKQFLHKNGEPCNCSEDKWYTGLSFKDSSVCHSGILVSSVEEANIKISESTDFPIDLKMNWIPDENERNLTMANFKRPTKEEKKRKVKRFAFSCYEFDLNQLEVHNSKFGFIRDGEFCKEVEKDHVTVFPAVDVLSGQYIVLNELKYSLSHDLLSKKWEPHCIRLIWSAEPVILESNYDREFYNACLSIFHYLHIINDYHRAMNLLRLLSVMESGGYHVVALKDIESPAVLQSVCKGISEIAEVINDFHEVNNLLTFMNCISNVVDLKLGKRDTKISLYGDILDKGETENEKNPQ
jgi:hypothetical protein